MAICMGGRRRERARTRKRGAARNRNMERIHHVGKIPSQKNIDHDGPNGGLTDPGS